MEPLSLSLGAAAVMGLSFGAGPCNVTCLPYLGPVFLSEQQRWRVVGLFSAGRLTGYALLGTAAGLLGESLQAFLDTSWGARLLGLATLLMGIALWRRASAPACNVAARSETQPVTFIPSRTKRSRGNGNLFLMGLGLALNPCTPLSALLLAAAATQSATVGGSLGIAFGLGAVLVPTLLFGFLIAHFGLEVRAHLAQWQPQLTRSAATLLLALGMATLLGWVRS